MIPPSDSDSPSGRKRRLMADLADFRGVAQQSDDITVVVASARPDS